MRNNPHKMELWMFLIAAVIAGIGLYFLGPSIIGFAIKELSYSQGLNLVVTSNGNYTLELDDIGELRSLKIDGRVTSYGKARVYIENNGIRYLVFDSTQLGTDANADLSNESNLITGFAVKSDKEKKDKNNKPAWIGENKFIVNGTTKINLSKYFIDEDNDELAYSVSEAENLDVSIDGSMVTIEPIIENEFNTTITFIASDGIDSKSHTVKLAVIAEKIEDIILPINETNETINATLPINETNQTINKTIDEINQTGLVNKTIAINLSYNPGTIYDANDNGEESVTGVVDLSVSNTGFSWEADESKLCTRWEIYNAEDEILTTFCNGNEGCCAFFGLLPSKQSWDYVYYSTYGSDGAGYNNIVSAQVVHYDVNITTENPKSEIYNSEWANLSVKFFEEEAEFFDECIETCSLTGLNKSRYALIFEIEDNAVLRIEKAKYSLLADVENKAPRLLKNITAINAGKNKSTINLSEYFIDEDGDRLYYNYYAADNLTILFEEDISTIIIDKGIEGVRYSYFIANDSELSAVSDVFVINITSEEKLISTANAFIIQNSLGENLAVIDSAGNMAIKGTLSYNEEPIADANDFVIQNSTFGLNLVVTNPEGNLLVKNFVAQSQNSLKPSPQSFIIQNSTGAVVAYVNSTGGLFLAGALAENAVG